jgi:Clustered mitochondria
MSAAPPLPNELRSIVLAAPVQALHLIVAEQNAWRKRIRGAQGAWAFRRGQSSWAGGRDNHSAPLQLPDSPEVEDESLPASQPTVSSYADDVSHSLSSSSSFSMTSSAGVRKRDAMLVDADAEGDKPKRQLMKRQRTQELGNSFWNNAGDNDSEGSDGAGAYLDDKAGAGVYLNDEHVSSDASTEGYDSPRPGSGTVPRRQLEQSLYDEFVRPTSTQVGEDGQDLITITDWNGRFQEAVNAVDLESGVLENRIENNLRLMRVFQDFLGTCETYGRVILSEIMLDSSHKTIRPAREFGGVAGGVKYVVQNILFKVALADSCNQLYQGDDAVAAKVAGHELKGVKAYFNSNTQGLHFPITVLIDYQGWRCVCESILPISSETLIYGTSNQGSSPPRLPSDNEVCSSCPIPVAADPFTARASLPPAHEKSSWCVEPCTTSFPRCQAVVCMRHRGSSW